MRVNVNEAALKLAQGNVVAIPTETVYGLAADARNEDALKQIYAIKERPANNPLIVHIGSEKQLTDWALAFPVIAQVLAKEFWPGPLTIVLKAQPHVSPILTAGQDTVALRVPNHDLTLQLLNAIGFGVAAPSANKYTQLSPTTAAHVEHGLGGGIAVMDGGPCSVGIESTIVEVYVDDEQCWQWHVLRAGMINESQIERTLGQAAISKSLSLAPQTMVPGQHLLHYSPVTPLSGFNSRAALSKQAATLANVGEVCVALLMGEECEQLNVYCKILPAEPAAYAEGLYGALHALDAVEADHILVEMPPRTVEWMAIIDRLSRAVYK